MRGILLQTCQPISHEGPVNAHIGVLSPLALRRSRHWASGLASRSFWEAGARTVGRRCGGVSIIDWRDGGVNDAGKLKLKGFIVLLVSVLPSFRSCHLAIL